jgi:lipopolysaccharide transport system ATP-binding protein
MKPIIKTTHLAKRYTIGEQGGSSVREVVNNFWNERVLKRKVFQGIQDPGRLSSYEKTLMKEPIKSIWALQDINLEIQAGESLGILGKNGSGKSTLLKILSRITAPTKGQALIRGKIAALLEIGTGFHPELTGRENIYLNGAILGMKRHEINRHLKSIIDFSEVGIYIDTPIKRYSSGMVVRLAFAVAAHLQADILIVDEVLAVGDFSFQKKCIDKMQERLRSGVTLLFVTHQLQVLANVCKRCVLLEHGKFIFSGATNTAITKYLSKSNISNAIHEWSFDKAPGNEYGQLRRIAVNAENELTDQVPIDTAINIEIEYDCLKADTPLSCALRLFDKMGTPIFLTMNLPSTAISTDSWTGNPLPIGRYRSTCTIPANFLNGGYYSAHIFLAKSGVDCIASATDENSVSFYAIDTGRMRKEFQGAWDGILRPKLKWETEAIGPVNNS